MGKAIFPIGITSFLGIFLGLLGLAAAIWFSAEDISVFFNLPGLFIVLGGTFAATVVSYPLPVIGSAIANLFKILFRRSPVNLEHRIEVFSQIMAKLRKGSIKEVEGNLAAIESPYLRTGIEMFIDGHKQDEIMRILDWRLERIRTKEVRQIRVFRSMAAYSPAFGMVGTLLGLINMLRTMESGDFEAIGLNMSIALVTTFYGIVLANILFKPLAVMLENKMQDDVVLLNFAKEAVSLLFEGKAPTYAKELLNMLVQKPEDEPI